MRQKSNLMLIAVFALVLTLPLAGVADRVFHSRRLSFFRTSAGHPELRSGHVVDIHPNGPVNGALERYMINGAKPETDYQVILQVATGGCNGGPFSPLGPTTTLTTNKQGNAQGQAAFTPEQLLPFANQVFGIYWTLVATGEVTPAYETICIPVAVD